MKPKKSSLNSVVSVVVAADYRMEIGLAVTLFSALRNLAPNCTLDIHILGAGLSARTVKKIEQSLNSLHKPYLLKIIKISDRKFQGFRRFANTSLFTYARFLIPDLCPNISKVIYLDIDILVMGDLSELFDIPLENSMVGAAVGCGVSRADHPWGIPNYLELGIPGESPYFSAGVMIMDLVAWRNAEFGKACMEYARKHADICIFWDQTVLNSLIAGQFRHIPEKWNQQLSTNPAKFREEGIIHFSGPEKPWNYQSPLPARLLELYFEELDRTAFAGWRPTVRISFFERVRRKIKRTILGF
jgi:lipopolysaccharide biosynthesis glycosyltransferase